MLPDEMEAEKNRKIILAQADEIEILKRNVKELQQSLQNAYADISRLAQKNNYLKERCNFSDVESHYMDNSIIVEREEV